jgi:hypothetical protein
MTKLSLEELRDPIRPLRDGYVGRKIQHVKSSDWYVVTGFHYREEDMTIWFSYETLHREPVSFLRPVVELFDNRFALKGPRS